MRGELLLSNKLYNSIIYFFFTAINILCDNKIEVETEHKMNSKSRLVSQSQEKRGERYQKYSQTHKSK